MRLDRFDYLILLHLNSSSFGFALPACVLYARLPSHHLPTVEDSDMVVQSGVPWEEINSHLASLSHPLFFPLDPGPGATIGGMIGTGCSGTNACRYGTARGEWVLNVVGF